MASRSEGEKAIMELSGKSFDGRQIKVNESKPLTETRRSPRY
jgi:RNA recognition motif-containing protein